MEKHKILIIDSNETDLHDLEKLLEKKFNVFLAASGEDALAIMEENEIALIIADYDIKDIDGVELLEEVRRKYPNTIRVILTSHTDKKMLMDAINKIQVYGFLKKPWKPEDMNSTVIKGVEAYETMRMPNQQSDDSKRSLGELLVDYNVISKSQLDEVMKLLKSGREQGELFITSEIISLDELETALELQLAETLISLGYAEEEDILFCHALQLGLDRKLLPHVSDKPELSKVMPLKLAYKHSIVPVSTMGKALIVAAPEPLNNSDISDIENELKRTIIVKAA